MSTLRHRTQKYIQALDDIAHCTLKGTVYMVLAETELTYIFKDSFGHLNELGKQFFKQVK